MTLPQFLRITCHEEVGSAHAPVNGGPVFMWTFLGHFCVVLFFLCVFFVFYFIKISKFALPGVMLMYERTSKDRKKERKSYKDEALFNVAYLKQTT